MRSALCLFGIVGGTNGKNGKGNTIDFVKCCENYHKHIIEVNHCDIFIHSWSIDYAEKLNAIYAPKKFLYEPQRMFNIVNKEELTVSVKRDTFLTSSRWYSTQQSINLKKQYEEDNGFQYDWVMISRFDLMFFVDFDFSKLDKGNIYISHFNNLAGSKNNHSTLPDKNNNTLTTDRYLDLWLVAGSQFMDQFGQLYDNFDKYSNTDPHHAMWQHIHSFAGDPRKITKFMFYRWYDYELDRIIKNGGYYI
jgi:hypothetical protein